MKCMLAEPKGKRNFIDTSWSDPASPLSQQVTISYLMFPPAGIDAQAVCTNTFIAFVLGAEYKNGGVSAVQQQWDSNVPSWHRWITISLCFCVNTIRSNVETDNQSCLLSCTPCACRDIVCVSHTAKAHAASALHCSYLSGCWRAITCDKLARLLLRRVTLVNLLTCLLCR